MQIDWSNAPDWAIGVAPVPGLTLGVWVQFPPDQAGHVDGNVESAGFVVHQFHRRPVAGAVLWQRGGSMAVHGALRSEDVQALQRWCQDVLRYGHLLDGG